MASHLQSSTEAHLALACVKLNDTQGQLAVTRAELNKAQIQLINTQTQLNFTQETTRDLMKQVDKLKRQMKEKLTKNQLNEAVESKVMKMKKARSFMWKIQNFSEQLRQAKERGTFKIVKSDPFYTESCGYKMQLLLYPNGNGSGQNTHISVFLSEIEGEYDSLLSWPFTTSVKFTLIDQQRFLGQNIDSHFFKYNVTERPEKNGSSSLGLGVPEFVTHEKLKTRRYLVDDILFLRVVIRPPDSTQLNWWSTYALSTSVEI